MLFEWLKALLSILHCKSSTAALSELELNTFLNMFCKRCQKFDCYNKMFIKNGKLENISIHSLYCFYAYNHWNFYTKKRLFLYQNDNKTKCLFLSFDDIMKYINEHKHWMKTIICPDSLRFPYQNLWNKIFITESVTLHVFNFM